MARRRLGFWQRFAVVLVKPVMTVWTRRTWRGWSTCTADGGVIIVPNHISHADPLVVRALHLRRRALAAVPGQGQRVPGAGDRLDPAPVPADPGERGTVDAVKSLDKLVAALAEGGAVVIYPEGTTTREPELWPMKGKTGAARLALATGAPVIPVAMWGPEQIFDPRTTRFGLRPRIPVTVVAGPPIDLSRWAGAAPTRAVLEEMTDTIMLRLRDMLAEIRGGTPPPLWDVRPSATEVTRASDQPAQSGGAAGVADRMEAAA